MNIDFPLPPDLKQFIRDQLAAGRFRSEDELLRTALHLLEEQSQTPELSADWLKQELDRGLSSRPSEPATPEFWEQIRRRLRTSASPADGD